MRKFNKVVATMICACTIAAMLTGCQVSIGKTGEPGKVETLDKTEVDSFRNIKLNVDVAEIDIIPEAEAFAIEYSIVNQNVNYKVADDVLTISAKAIQSVNMKGNENSYIKIYVPEGNKFEKFGYEGNVGDINIGNLTFDDVNIKTDVGNVKLTDIYVNNILDVRTNVGNIAVKLENTECSYKVYADIANIRINDSSYAGMVIEKISTSQSGPQVNIKTDCGNINLNY